MESGLIPPNINYEKPSEKITALAKGRLKVVTDLTPWDGKYAAVNTASLTGNSTHIILKGFKKKKKNGGRPEDDLPRLVIASGRTKAAVETVLDDVRAAKNITPENDYFYQELENSLLFYSWKADQ